VRRDQFDVVVVGASLAGCTTATLYARHGLSVALLEAHRDPGHYKRACTHFIQPTAWPVLRRLGLDDAIMDAGGRPNRLAIWTRWGWLDFTGPAAVTDGPAAAGPDPAAGGCDVGVNIRRAQLDPLLRSRTAAEPGVTLLAGQRVTDLVVRAGRVVGVRTGAGGGEREVLGRLVVGADGRNSRVAERAGQRETVRPHGRFVYFAPFTGVRLPDGASRMWMLEPDIAYAFPNGEVTILSVMPTRDRLDEFRADPRRHFFERLHRLPDGPDLAAAEQVGDLSGVLNYACVSRRPVAPGLALVGDAAMTSDYLWGTGCSFAFRSAAWLVDATAAALTGRADLAPGLRRYAIRHRQELAGHHRLMSDYAGGRAFNPVERLLYAAAVRDPRIARHVTEFGERRMSVRRFLSPGVLARSVLINRPRPAAAAA
jgi:2-polyprenyl-6-methoxyphenol hydroxylase-like FAD-dependent oxidoreductase